MNDNIEDSNFDLNECTEERRMLLELMPVGVTITDEAGNILEANQMSTELLGVARSEHMQRRYDGQEWHIIRPDGTLMPPEEYTSVRALREQRLIRNEEMGVIRPDGSITWISVSAVPLPLLGLGVAIAYADITARKQAEEALRESERRYRLLFDQMLNGFALHKIICDAHGYPVDYRFLEINPAFEQLTGLRAEDLIGRTAREVLPNTEDYWIERYGRVALTGVPTQFESYSQELDRYYAVSAFAPEVGYFAVLFSDVTERKKTEMELRKLLRAVEQSAGSVVITDTDGTIEYVNPYFSRLTGYTFEQAIGQNPRLLQSGRHSCEFYQTLWDTITDGDIWRGEFCNLSKDGTVFWELASISPVQDDQGLITHFVKVAEDITQRKQMEMELQQAQVELQAYAEHLEQMVADKVNELQHERAKVIHADKMASLGELATGMAHELNQPLTAILLEADYLKALAQQAQGDTVTLKTEDLLQMGENLAGDIARSQRIISHLRAFGRVSEDMHVPVSLNQAIENCFILVGARLKVHDVHIELDLSRNLPPIQANVYRLEQVFLNFISNAEHALETMEQRVHAGEVSRPNYHKLLKLATWVEGPWVLASICDNGCGIPASVQTHIFEPFFTTKPVGQGTGLGLSISHGIVVDYGGDITFESVVNQGTTFRLRFPVVNVQDEVQE